MHITLAHAVCMVTLADDVCMVALAHAVCMLTLADVCIVALSSSLPGTAGPWL